MRSRHHLYRLAFALADAWIWVLALFLAVFLRYDFSFPIGAPTATAKAAILVAAVQLGLGHLLGPYRVSHARGSYEESFDLGRTTVLATMVAFAVVAVWRPSGLPRSAPVIGGALALLGMFALRVLFRSFRTRQARGRDVERAIVFGAGFAGRRLIKSAMQEQTSPILPVAILDDDPTKAKVRIDGVPVRGTRADLRAVAEQTDASVLVIAAPRAKPKVLRELSEVCSELGLEVKVLPPLDEIIRGAGSVADLRDLNVADLLGRRPVHLDMGVVAKHLSGRRVLVTGAGGSIGSELCRQIAQFNPERIFLLDRDESGLQATQLSLTGHGLLNTDDVILTDIREADTMRRILEATRPSVVFHAAALKHLPLLEQYPLEAWKTNVHGTLNVLEAAAAVGVDTFVNISTDKAAAPTSVLGFSKRLTERLTAHFGQHQPGRYVSVRFGNVIGSRGSVLHAFTTQIEAGGPVTVTHPDVQRFFMLVSEACQLVLEAAAIGTSGEVMVLDMGEPVRIMEVARSLIRMSGRKDVDITITGLREGEKLDEDLFFAGEDRRRTVHPLIDAVPVPPLAPAQLPDDRVADHPQARQLMTDISVANAIDPPADPPAQVDPPANIDPPARVPSPPDAPSGLAV